MNWGIFEIGPFTTLQINCVGKVLIRLNAIREEKAFLSMLHFPLHVTY